MMHTSTLMTAEDLLVLPEDHKRHELVRGVLTVMAPAGGEHGDIGTNLTVAIANFLAGARLGRVHKGDAGFVLARGPDTVRAPDVAFIRGDRLPGGRSPRGYIPAAPDLAAEIVSPTDKPGEIDKKIQEYLSAGTTLVWLVRPRRQSVTVYRRGRRPMVLASHGTLDGEDVLPGFFMPVAALFV